ncbi:MAG: YggS family pyridoxal phosphate-dependent enzyme [Methylophilales bacterium]|nr:YggS family pyridoxal phosphate-dependent enzyme [Methylophilales bacterium]
MNIIGNRLQLILANIKSIKTNNQSSQSVQLLAVSKTQSASIIREAFEVGIHSFGENYLQEALEKQSQLTDLPIEWHFIGPIQSNKTQPIAQNFSWVHSVDRLKIAQRLNDARPIDLDPLNICIQLNVDSEESKGGVAIHEAESLAAAISNMPHLKLRGLMAIPEPSTNVDKQRMQFKKVRGCYDNLLAKGYALDTLSIGMSEDYPIAIEQGATIVRIGSALFGARQPKPPLA